MNWTSLRHHLSILASGRETIAENNCSNTLFNGSTDTGLALHIEDGITTAHSYTVVRQIKRRSLDVRIEKN